MTREEEIKEQAEKKALEPSRLMHPYAKQYKVMSAYEIGFIEGAVWADAHPHWINVEDELPPKQAMRQQSKDVLVRTNTGRIKIEYYDYDNEVIKQWWKNYITHWCYLPQLPVLSNSKNIGMDLK